MIGARLPVIVMGHSDERSFRRRGTSALEDALPTLLRPPAGLIAITEVLRSSPVDLRRLRAAGECHSDLTAELLHLCNSSILGLTEPVESLEQATILLGAEVLKTLSLAWGIVETVGRSLSMAAAQTFWQHGFTVALLSERIAARARYPIIEAHLAGVLHDIGRVPLLMIFEKEKCDATAFFKTPESPQAEAQRFSVDHCELGRRIGIAWGFSDIFVEVFGRHHKPRPRAGELDLVRIVREAEAQSAALSPANKFMIACEDTGPSAAVLDLCSSQSSLDQPVGLIELLELELLQAVQHVNPGNG